MRILRASMHLPFCSWKMMLMSKSIDGFVKVNILPIATLLSICTSQGSNNLRQ